MLSPRESAEILALVLLGGKGSGNFGHAGRPGLVGGSSDNGPASVSLATKHGTTLLAEAASFILRDGTMVRSNAMHHQILAETAGTTLQELESEGVIRRISNGVETPDVPSWQQATLIADDWNTDRNTTMHLLDVAVGGITLGSLSLDSRRVTAELIREFTKRALAHPKTEPPIHEQRVLAAEASPLHQAADAHVNYLAVALRYAFAMGRREIAGVKDLARLENLLPKILKRELMYVLPAALEKAAVAGARVAIKMRGLGGPGSGNFGHKGRPGLVGGSAPDAFPEGLTQLTGAKGSNPGGVYRDKDGLKWYVKHYKDADQAAGEHVANAVYARIGVDAADSRLSDDGKTIALLWRDGTVLNKHGLDKATADRLLDGFAGDVFLQNWDAVGTGHDNVLVKSDGSVMRVDQGGTLLHRAMGALKPEDGRHEIREWDTLRSLNPYYAQVFKKAGVPSGDAMGERAAKQIDRIVQARPEKGWEWLVREVAPLASESYKIKVGAMLEARQKALEKKRDQLRLKTLGGPGSGHFGHQGGAGGENNPGGSDGGDIVIVKKAKAPPATKDQIATAVQMKADGKSYAEIQAETGLNPKQAATIVHKHKKAQGAAKEALAPVKMKPTIKNKPALDPDEFADLMDQGYKWKPTGVNETWAFFDKNGIMVSGYFPYKTDIEEAAVILAANVAKSSSIPSTSTPAPSSFISSPELGTLATQGYEWKEKTSGPNKGKYAFFQNGVQVSSFADKADWSKAAPTIHQGKGAGWKPEPPPPKPGTIGQSGLIADVVGKHSDALSWPIDDDVVRTEGSLYPKVVKAKGDELRANLTVTERSAIASYIGSSHDINQKLREGKSSATIKAIESALDKAPSPPPPELVWRGVSAVDSEKLIAALETGDILQLKGFQSTSISPQFASDWASNSGKTLFEIKPKKGGYIAHIGSLHHEYEFLLPHGAKYVVRGVAKVKIGSKTNTRKVIQLEML